MGRLDGVVYFADENCLGLARLLIARGRVDVVHPGHDLLPEVPRETPDLEWMPIVAKAGLIVVTRDRRIRTRPAELREYRSQGLRSVWLGAKKDRTPAEQVSLFLRHEVRLQREAVKRGPGPWALAMTENDVRPLRIRDE